MRIAIALLALMPLASSAEVFKCLAGNGKVIFADRPCDSGRGESGQVIDLKTPQSSSPSVQAPSKEAQDAEWEKAKRFYYVEIPQVERQAAALMASPDPAAQTLGKELAWKARQGREAFLRMRELHGNDE